MDEYERTNNKWFIKLHMYYITKEWDEKQKYLDELLDKGLALNGNDINDPRCLLYNNVLSNINDLMYERANALVDLYCISKLNYDANMGSLKYIYKGVGYFLDCLWNGEVKVEDDTDDYLKDLFATYLYLDKLDRKKVFDEFYELFDRLCNVKVDYKYIVHLKNEEEWQKFEDDQASIFHDIDEFDKKYS